MNRYIFIFFLSLFLNNPTIWAKTIVRHIPAETEKDLRRDYYLQVLNLALEKTKPTHGDFELQESKHTMYQSRALKSLSEGKFIDIVWTMTSKQREQENYPIRVPLLKGLLGHRVFLIHKKDLHRFAQIKTVNDLKKLTALQGHDWPDTQILRKNNFHVKGVANYDQIFEILNAGRYDFFPRGVNEPWDELKARPKLLNLVIEPNLMLVYPAPIYFFVNKKNAKLARRIKKGLDLAIEDGSFDKLFYDHPAIKKIFSESNLDKRTIFRIPNPLLTPQTPISDKKYWFKIGKN